MEKNVLMVNLRSPTDIVLSPVSSGAMGCSLLVDRKAGVSIPTISRGAPNITVV